MGVQSEHKLRMFYSVGAVCDNRPELWSENETFIVVYSKYRCIIPQIKRYKDILTVETLVSRSFKSIDRIELEEFSLFLISRILLLAKELKLEELYEEVRHYRNSIVNCTDNEFVRICKNIVIICQTYIIGLESYAISPEEIAELQHLTAAYAIHNSRSHHPRNSSTEEQLKKMFKEAEELLKNQLDHAMEEYKISEPEFYEEYIAARIIPESKQNIYKEMGQAQAILN